MNLENNLRQALSDAQYAAVMDNSSHILCLACAGSGKSRTLAYRIARLVAEGEPPESIVAFTFTTKAADSLKQRVSEALRSLALPESVMGLMSIGTMDSFCHRLLGNMNAKYRQFSVLDDFTFRAFLMRHTGEINENHSRLGPDANAMYNNWKTVWQNMNSESISLDQLKGIDESLYHQMCTLRKIMLETGFMDFSFAIQLTLEELKKPESAGAVSGYRHLLVDEYQDINPAQEDLIRTLAEYTGNLLVVGDDDQAIYSWRGANVQNILTFQKRYSDVTVHKLETNYRSCAPIALAAAEYAQKRLQGNRLEKDVTAPSIPENWDLRKLTFQSMEEEAEWIAARIHSLLGTPYIQYDSQGNELSRRGLCYSDFAVLLRNVRSNGKKLDESYAAVFRKYGIPVRVASRDGLFQRSCADAIRKVLTALNSSNPISQASLVFLRKVFPNADIPALQANLTAWQNIFFGKETFIHVSPQAIYLSLVPHLYVDITTQAETLRDLGALSQAIADFEMVNGKFIVQKSYQRLLNYFTFLKNQNYDCADHTQNTDPAVTISTIHKAKGLEYPVVFVANLYPQQNKAKHPYSGILAPLLKDAVARGSYVDSPEEENRLYYTAFTRAERYLYVSGVYQGDAVKFFPELQHPDLRTDKQYVESNEKLEPTPKSEDDKIPSSFSSVKHYLSCPYSYWLTEQCGFRSVPLDLAGFGTTAHSAAERLHQRCTDHVPTEAEILAVVEEVFLLRNITPKQYQYAQQKQKLVRILKQYCNLYKNDFHRLRQDEARFEMTLDKLTLTGFIDLLLHEDNVQNVTQADLIDFKTMELPDDIQSYNWRDMALQVQLYTKAVREIYGEKVQTGWIHTLKDNKRTSIPVDNSAIADAEAIIDWAAEGILAGDYPMRPTPEGCKWCDCSSICPKHRQTFARSTRPPEVHTPVGPQELLCVLEP